MNLWFMAVGIYHGRKKLKLMADDFVKKIGLSEREGKQARLRANRAAEDFIVWDGSLRCFFVVFGDVPKSLGLGYFQSSLLCLQIFF